MLGYPEPVGVNEEGCYSAIGFRACHSFVDREINQEESREGSSRGTWLFMSLFAE